MQQDKRKLQRKELKWRGVRLQQPAICPHYRVPKEMGFLLIFDIPGCIVFNREYCICLYKLHFIYGVFVVKTVFGDFNKQQKTPHYNKSQISHLAHFFLSLGLSVTSEVQKNVIMQLLIIIGQLCVTYCFICGHISGHGYIILITVLGVSAGGRTMH